ncbi:MAG TPA: hypothetical protein VK850_11855, partial [Candidatus Binatia bacterium]|nr:hypothetical protein [Candidatus Binatia bacterium]
PELFRLMTQTVVNVSAEAVIRFEVELLTEMGMAPDQGLNAQQLGRFILYHLGKVPAGRDEALRQD